MKMCSVVLFALLVGCGVPLTRTTPSEAEYVERFLNFIPADRIKSLQFKYRGAVGGELSIARFVTDPQGLERIKQHATAINTCLSSDNECQEELASEISFIAGGTVPEWFVFPVGRTITVYSDEQNYTSEHPAFSYRWCIDASDANDNDNAITVYFLFISG